MPIPLGQRIQHRRRSLPMFAVRQLLLWIVSRIEQLVRGMIAGVEAVAVSSLLGAPLQGEVVRDSKEPSLQIRSCAVLAQMPEQGQEHILDEIFAFADGDAKRTHIAQKRISELVEECEHFAFNREGVRGLGRSDRGQSQEVDRRAGGWGIHRANSTHVRSDIGDDNARHSTPRPCSRRGEPVTLGSRHK